VENALLCSRSQFPKLVMVQPMMETMCAETAPSACLEVPLSEIHLQIYMLPTVIEIEVGRQQIQTQLSMCDASSKHHLLP
jgi:hypothetical protein